MKKFIFIFLFCVNGFFTHAQEIEHFVIKGTTVDSTTNNTLSFVTISVFENSGSNALISNLSKGDGNFIVSLPKQKNYQLVFSNVGYLTKTIQIKNDGTDTVNEGRVALKPLTKQLKEVTVTAAKPLTTQLIDRISYNVQQDPENKVLNVFDMLRKVPFISIDAGDNILLKGNGKYKILINGRSSSLVINNPADVFKAMPASNIQRIEVITVPPSKYDAEGLAGLINIVLKKPIGPGYNASINLRENTITGPVGGVSITSKAGKLGITYNAGYSDQIKRDGSSVNTLQTFNPSNTFLDQIAKNTNQGHNIYSGLELSYEIDTLNLVTGNFNYTRGQNSFNNRQTSQLFDVANSLIQNYNLNSNSNSNYHGIDFGINYQLGFKKSKDQLLTFSYQYTTGPHSSLNDLQFFDRYNFTTPDYDQNNESGTKENTIQIDYQQPLKHVSMEAGIKAILRNNYSNFNTEQLDSLSHNYVNDPTSSNDFTYHQDVYSAYNSYQFNYGTWGLKAGVRAERTDIDANFITSQTLLQQGYTNFIPSINILKSLKNNINLNFGFTNRIERPNIYELNPFVDESNPKFVSTGNPDLRPVLNHTLELGFSKYGKGSLNLTVSYAFANNTIQNVTNLRDSVSYTTYQNVGSDKLLGLNMSFNYPLFKGCNFGINGEVDYVTLKGYFNQSLYENSGFQGFGFANLGYQVNDTWRVGLNGAIYSANILLQGKSNPYYFSSINTTKDIFKKKVTVFFYVNNITQKYKTSKSYASDPAFYETNLSENLYRTIGFGFYYHFGKFNRDIKKNRTGINNDDLSNHKKSDNN